MTSRSEGQEAALARDLLGTMMLIRSYEQHVERLYFQGRLTGFHHGAIGAEAICTGTAHALERTDFLVSTHRGHGDAIAKGAPMDALLAELHGNAEGCSRGRGGSMHICAPEVGFTGVSALVGGTIPIAAGLGFAAKYQDSGAVAVAAFGDGATNTGSFHETLNVASLWKLPAVFVCNNNGYAESTPRTHHQPIKRISIRARSYAMPGKTVNGRDVFAVYREVEDAVKRARGGEGPTLIECVSPRWHGHYIGDSGKAYMPEAERKRARKKDPLDVSGKIAQSQGWLSAADLEDLKAEAERKVEKAQSSAEASPPAEASFAFEGIGATELGIVG